jgi:hypothetical protein
VAEREEESAGGGVTCHGGDGGHGQREEVGCERAERVDELPKARSGAPRPAEVESVGEEAALHDSDQSGPRARRGRGHRDGGDSGADGGDEWVAEAVLAVAGKGEDEDASALLQGAHGAGGWIGRHERAQSDAD